MDKSALCVYIDIFSMSTSSMGLAPLHEEIYFDFARRFFAAKKGSLSEEAFHIIYQTFDGITYNVQQISK